MPINKGKRQTTTALPVETLLRSINGTARGPAVQRNPPNDGVKGLDGDEWVIEGVSQGKYHFVERWCATAYGPKKRGLANFDALCKVLVDKSKLSVRPTNGGHKLI